MSLYRLHQGALLLREAMLAIEDIVGADVAAIVFEKYTREHIRRAIDCAGRLLRSYPAPVCTAIVPAAASVRIHYIPGYPFERLVFRWCDLVKDDLTPLQELLSTLSGKPAGSAMILLKNGSTSDIIFW